jgi:hypothetical protein
VTPLWCLGCTLSGTAHTRVPIAPPPPRWLEASHRVAQALEAAGGSGAAVRMVTWQAPLWPRAVYDTNFKAWQKRRGKQPLLPLPPPGSLNGPLPAGVRVCVGC